MKNFIKTLLAASLMLAGVSLPAMIREETNTRAVQADGKIVEADVTGDGLLFISRFNTDGTFDATFGSFGSVILGLNHNFSSVNSVTIEPDGKILVRGMSDGRPLKARFITTGILDISFGDYGIEITE